MCVLLTLCIAFLSTSCRGISLKGGYVFQKSGIGDANYVIMWISDTEYIHFLWDGYGEWVTDTSVSMISFHSAPYFVRNADAYWLTCMNTDKDTDWAKIAFGGDIEKERTEYYVHNPDRKKNIIYMENQTTNEIIYISKSKIEMLYKENIEFFSTSRQWKEFFDFDDSTIYRSLDFPFWYSPNTNEGEWIINDLAIPIEIEFYPYGPGIKLYDMSDNKKTIILYGSGALSDDNTLILDNMWSDVFYKNSIHALTLIKTTK